MSQLLNVYKPRGLTPLDVIKLIRVKFPELKKEKIGFAGRLDPLAHGVLLLMIGSETTKQKDQFLNLPKEYEFEAVFGIATDTYDALGIIQNINVIARSVATKQSLEIKIINFIKSKLGQQIQPYPPFSSKTVAGKPLFWWAKNNKLAEIKIPEREIEIYDFQLLNTKSITKAQLKNEIMKQIKSVTGDFRQKEIINKWQTYFTTHYKLPTTYYTARFTISGSSGTYVRSLVHELGAYLGTGAITLEILRTKIGDYSLKDAQTIL